MEDLRVLQAVTRLTVYRLPQVMRAWAYDVPCGPNIFVVEEVFKLEMLRIVLSELNEI